MLHGLKDQLRRCFGDEVVVETAESGDEGLQVFDDLRAEGAQVPVVLSDQLMPGMKGEEFLASIHERDPRTLNILLTGQATVDAVGHAVNRARLYRYIAKPWTEADLTLTVREALRAWRQSRELDRRADELALAHAAALRFVPAELLALLGRRRVADVTFGDHAVRSVTIMFSDMRGFTTLLESLDPSDAFRFVNEYIQRMEAPIRAHGGFIVNVEGDAILAMFPTDPQGSVRAGIDSQRALAAYNQERRARGEPPIGMGLGVHSGDLLLGTIGGEERLACDVVGSPVNLCSRLEGLTKHYGTHMLVSAETVRLLADPSEFRLREVDRVQAKGLTSAVTLFEVLDALPEESARARLGTLSAFGAARELFVAGDFAGAEDAFAAIVARDPGDGVAAVYRARCVRLRSSPAPEGWSGVTELRVK